MFSLKNLARKGLNEYGTWDHTVSILIDLIAEVSLTALIVDQYTTQLTEKKIPKTDTTYTPLKLIP